MRSLMLTVISLLFCTLTLNAGELSCPEQPIESEKLLPSALITKVDCAICLEQVDSKDLVRACDQHSACRACVHDWIRARIKDRMIPIPCLNHAICKKTFGDDVLKAYLNEDELGEYFKQKKTLGKKALHRLDDWDQETREKILNRELQFCPRCDVICQKTIDGCNSVTCQSCRLTFRWNGQHNCMCQDALCSCYCPLASALCQFLFCFWNPCYYQSHFPRCKCFR